MRRALVVLAVVLLNACGADETESSSAPNEFEQTWSTSYNQTTCSQWSGQMTPHQRRVAAADMLVGARKVDGGDDLPSGQLIDSFTADVSSGCEPIGSMSITEVAAATYLIDRARYGP